MVTRPLTLTSAIGLARLYEAQNLVIKKISQSEVKKQPPSNRPPNHQPPFPIKRLTPAELKERQEKGLCFKCNDKYGPCHWCKRLFMIEACLDGDGDVVMEDEEGEDENPLEISLHAIQGKEAPKTMNVYGLIDRTISLALIDSGRTHNFVSLALAQLLNLQPQEGGGMEVIVASGEKIRSLGKCFQVSLRLQGVSFMIDFYILPLEGYGVVLGTQWLLILGPIWLDFDKLKIRFD
jgi:hypothetical protein